MSSFLLQLRTPRMCYDRVWLYNRILKGSSVCVARDGNQTEPQPNELTQLEKNYNVVLFAKEPNRTVRLQEKLKELEMNRTPVESWNPNQTPILRTPEVTHCVKK